MINRLRKTNNLPIGGGETVGFIAEDRSDRVAFNFGRSDDNLKRFVPGNKMIMKTANFAVLPKDDGKVFGLNLAAGIVASLPESDSLSDGMEVTFVSYNLPTSGVGHSISPTETDFISGHGLTAVPGKDLIHPVASDRLYDSVTLRADGNGGWVIVAALGTYSKEA